MATAFAAIAIAAAPAFALTLNAAASIPAVGITIATNADASASGTKAQQRGDMEIDTRITDLTALDTRIQAMAHVSDSDKSSLDSGLQAQISALNTLKAKIGSDTDAASIKADDASITKAYRIFLLVLPQGRIVAAADRALDIGTSFATLGAKFQAEIGASTASSMITSTWSTTLADLNAKVADANTKANAAITATANLAPDNGDASIQIKNKTAIIAGKQDITAANTDLKAAWADARSLAKSLKASGSVSASASGSTQ